MASGHFESDSQTNDTISPSLSTSLVNPFSVDDWPIVIFLRNRSLVSSTARTRCQPSTDSHEGSRVGTHVGHKGHYKYTMWGGKLAAVAFAPLCQVTLSGFMSRRAKRVTSSSVSAVGSVFSIPSFYGHTQNEPLCCRVKYRYDIYFFFVMSFSYVTHTHSLSIC